MNNGQLCITTVLQHGPYTGYTTFYENSRPNYEQQLLRNLTWRDQQWKIIKPNKNTIQNLHQKQQSLYPTEDEDFMVIIKQQCC